MQPTQWVTEGAGTPGPGAYYTPQQMSTSRVNERECSRAYAASEGYLQDLRTNRPARPTGSRPPPAHFKTWSNRESSRVQDIPTIASLQAVKDTEVKAEAQTPVAPTSQLHRRGDSSVDSGSPVDSAGKALVQPPRGRESVTPSHERRPSVEYREDPRRKMERRESSEIRAAMDKMDVKDEEKLYEAARDEAAEIVWKHRNPNAPENNPNAPYAYPGSGRNALQRPKLQRTRSRSVGPQEDTEQDLQRANSKMRKRHSIGSSAGSRSSSMQTHLPHQVHSSAARQPKTHSTSRSPKHHPTCPNSARRVDPVARQAAASSRTPTTRSTKSPRRKHPLLPHRPPWQPSLRSLLLYPWACAETPSLAFSLSKALEW
jgi:hypothetical protein